MLRVTCRSLFSIRGLARALATGHETIDGAAFGYRTRKHPAIFGSSRGQVSGVGRESLSHLALDVGAPISSPAASAAILLYLVYPIVRQVALALDLDPDTPHTLSKVTSTL